MNGLMARALYPCAHIPDLTYDYLEGRLPALTTLRFKAHLAMCEGCAEFVSLYTLAADPVRFLDETPPPSELVELTLSFLDKELDRERGTAERDSIGEP